MEELIALANTLRKNRDKITKGDGKFTLSVDLLNKLNSYINLLIERRELNVSFHVSSVTNETKKVYNDLLYLYNFIQTASSLKLIGDTSEFANLSKFANLKLLELYKVNVNAVLGLERLRPKIECLICQRSLRSIKDILKKRPDESDGSVDTWLELKEICFSHNSLQSIDDSVKLAPYLSILDLSHNELKVVENLSYLTNLKHLNLSFNKMTRIPLLTGQVCSRLQVLVLNNNFIDNTQDVKNLINLLELDLSENCLIGHNSLSALSYLATLQVLKLFGNPLSFHPLYRMHTVRYLHSNTATVKFSLDGSILKKTEQSVIGTLFARGTYKKTEDVTSEVISENECNSDRNRRVRYAIIFDNEEPPEITRSVSVPTDSNIRTTENVPQLKEMHKEYMKSLYSKSESEIEASLDVQQFSACASSTPYSEVLDVNKLDNGKSLYETVRDESLLQTSDDNYMTASEILNVEVNNDVGETKDSDEKHKEEKEADGIYSNVNKSESSDDEDLESGEDNIFIATTKGSEDEIFVIITKTHITEKNPINMRSMGRFALESLVICEMVIESDVSYIYLRFDTVRKDRVRYYAMGAEERNRFFERLKKIVDARPPDKEPHLLYCCMKCSRKFEVAKPKSMHQENPTCVNCDSPLVFQVDS